MPITSVSSTGAPVRLIRRPAVASPMVPDATPASPREVMTKAPRPEASACPPMVTDSSMAAIRTVVTPDAAVRWSK
ncbi:hypothetical protein [Desulfatiferula olefinivorans]